MGIGVASLTQPDIKPDYKGGIYKSKVRFDSSRKAARAHGAVFPDYVPTFTLSQSVNETMEAVRHIDDAQHHVERTFPSWLGKTIPGDADRLHRIVNEEWINGNNVESMKVCNDVWGDLRGTGLECDEYPFASSVEGAKTGKAINGGKDRFSARPINGGHNGAAGRKLGTFYGDNRVIDGDPFLVKIVR